MSAATRQPQAESSSDDSSHNKIVLGRLSGAHGIKGWNKLQSYTAAPEDIGNYSHWYLRGRDEQEWRPVECAQMSSQGKRLLVRLQDCEDRNQAEALVGCEVAVDASALPTLDEGEYYWYELKGLRVVSQTAEGTVVLGRIADLIETGANDVLVVHGKACADAVDQRERLIPYLPDQVVKQVDLDAGTILVEWDVEF